MDQHAIALFAPLEKLKPHAALLVCLLLQHVNFSVEFDLLKPAFLPGHAIA